MKTIEIKIYSFNELNEEAKQNAIINHRDFEDSIYDPNDEFYSCYEDYEDFYNSLDDDYITENILINEYLFFNDGSLCNSTTYTGKHPKAGITEIEIFKNTYIID